MWYPRRATVNGFDDQGTEAATHAAEVRVPHSNAYLAGKACEARDIIGPSIVGKILSIIQEYPPGPGWGNGPS